MEAVNISIENLADLQRRMKEQMEAVACLARYGVLKIPQDITLETLGKRIGDAFVKSIKVGQKAVN
jgi:hypothetical protein